MMLQEEFVIVWILRTSLTQMVNLLVMIGWPFKSQSLCEEEVPSVWMWSMRAWHIKLVFLNGVSLYEHDQTHIYNTAMNAIGRRIRVGVRSYQSSRERREPNLPLKKDSLLTLEAITEVSTKTCCPNNCLQPFPMEIFKPYDLNCI